MVETTGGSVRDRSETELAEGDARICIGPPPAGARHAVGIALIQQPVGAAAGNEEFHEGRACWDEGVLWHQATVSGGAVAAYASAPLTAGSSTSPPTARTAFPTGSWRRSRSSTGLPATPGWCASTWMSRSTPSLRASLHAGPAGPGEEEDRVRAFIPEVLATSCEAADTRPVRRLEALAPGVTEVRGTDLQVPPVLLNS